ncbi:MAG: 30S ribosomal protein S2 [bacterium]|nr:30S ribosomal protein S2 [bacterium]
MPRTVKKDTAAKTTKPKANSTSVKKAAVKVKKATVKKTTTKNTKPTAKKAIAKTATKTIERETISASAGITAQQLLVVGAHFGHQTRRWNPKMADFIFVSKNGIHVIDLTKTVDLLKKAADFAHKIALAGGEILFVGTKRQAQEIIKKAAIEAGMPYVANRWLGGMLTNYQTISESIKRLKKLEEQGFGEEPSGDTKKEASKKQLEITKLNDVLGGIKQMKGLPSAVFIVDIPREHIAVSEAYKLNIPVIAIVDTNADPSKADYPIPANDDAIKSISLITEAIAKAAREGRKVYDAKTKEISQQEEAENE